MLHDTEADQKLGSSSLRSVTDEKRQAAAEQASFPGRPISYREARLLALNATAREEQLWDKAVEAEAEFFDNILGSENGEKPR